MARTKAAALLLLLWTHPALAVVNGRPATEATAVVAISGKRGPVCSGTLVSPRVVLTAAHCFLGGSVITEAVVLDTPAGQERVAIRNVRVAPGYQRSTFADDLALILLDRDVTPTPSRIGPLGGKAGSTLTIVGYGVDPVSDGSGERTAGEVRLASMRDGRVVLEGMRVSQRDFLPISSADPVDVAPAHACRGDSGGPLLEAGVVVGVISSGDAGCVSGLSATLLDARLLEFLHSYLQETEPHVAAPGGRCFNDASCREGSCIFSPEAPGRGYCSSPCERDDSCASNQRCEPATHSCRYPNPAPGALGSTCEVPWDCGRGVCARVAGQKATCVEPCSGSDLACSGGQRCLPVTPVGFVGPVDHACALPPPPVQPSRTWPMIAAALALVGVTVAGGAAWRRARRPRVEADSHPLRPR